MFLATGFGSKRQRAAESSAAFLRVAMGHLTRSEAPAGRGFPGSGSPRGAKLQAWRGVKERAGGCFLAHVKKESLRKRKRWSIINLAKNSRNGLYRRLKTRNSDTIKGKREKALLKMRHCIATEKGEEV